jgi:hypothetical protein
VIAVSSLAGMLLLSDGQVLWTDLASNTADLVAETVQLQELHALRVKATGLLEFCGGDAARRRNSKFQVTDSELEVSGSCARCRPRAH